VPISTDAFRHPGLKPVRAVLFDFAETLLVPEEAPQMIRAGLSTLGQAMPSDSEIDRIAAQIETALVSTDYLATKKQRDLSASDHRAAFTAAFSAAETLVEGLADAMYDRLKDPAAWRPFADTKPTLAALRNRGIKVGVVSNIGFDIRPIFSFHGLDDLVDTFALSFEHGAVKPDPALFEVALRAVDADASESLMVGDNVADAGAVRAGICVFLLPPVVPEGDRGLEEILALCVS
jgi:HAD superfamily hydrolase (TIGR01493 family)